MRTLCDTDVLQALTYYRLTPLIGWKYLPLLLAVAKKPLLVRKFQESWGVMVCPTLLAESFISASRHTVQK